VQREINEDMCSGRSTKTKPMMEDVLEFMDDADAKEWYQIAKHVRQQNPIRDIAQARLLRIGDNVPFHWPRSAGRYDLFQGTITRIDTRNGRVQLVADFGDGRPTPCGLPATMVVKV
jgi:hypothetical protein